MRVLAVGAHPDDMEILCADTLAKFAKQGNKIIMAHLTNGDKGHYEMDSVKLADIRRVEALDSAKIIGAKVISMEISGTQKFFRIGIYNVWLRKSLQRLLP